MRTKWSHELNIISYVYIISDMTKTLMIHLLRHHFKGGMGHWWVEGFVPGSHLGGMGHLWAEGLAPGPHLGGMRH